MSDTIRCAYCSGTGKDPFEILSNISVCLVCNGAGQVKIKEPAVKCVYCSGTGRNPLGSRIHCIVCMGKGVNHVLTNEKCTQCKGSGKSSDGLPCTLCGGTGFRK
ncbi:MAG: hypothetical protein ACOYN6_11155 [Ignavibacteria bacterium]